MRRRGGPLWPPGGPPKRVTPPRSHQSAVFFVSFLYGRPWFLNPSLESAWISGYNDSGYLAHLLWPDNCYILSRVCAGHPMWLSHRHEKRLEHVFGGSRKDS